MEKTTLQNIIDIVSKNGVIGLLCLVIWWFGSAIDTRLNDFNKRLETISKEIVEIRVQLAQINSSYSSKEETRRIVDEAIEKHEQKFHFAKN